MNPLFKAFLKMEGIYFIFILNAFFSSSTLQQKRIFFKTLKDPDKFAMESLFNWSMTEEGSDYWKSKSDKWKMFYFTMRANGYMKSHSTDLD